MREAQCIVCKCGSVVAACVVPSCFQDKDWMRDVRKYSSEGYKIEMRECETQNWFLAKCTCQKVTNQLQLI